MKSNLEEYFKVLDEDIKSLLTPEGYPLGRTNAIVVSALRTVKEDIKEIIEGRVVKRC